MTRRFLAGFGCGCLCVFDLNVRERLSVCNRVLPQAALKQVDGLALSDRAKVVSFPLPFGVVDIPGHPHGRSDWRRGRTLCRRR